MSWREAAAQVATFALITIAVFSGVLSVPAEAGGTTDLGRLVNRAYIGCQEVLSRLDAQDTCIDDDLQLREAPELERAFTKPSRAACRSLIRLGLGRVANSVVESQPQIFGTFGSPRFSNVDRTLQCEFATPRSSGDDLIWSADLGGNSDPVEPCPEILAIEGCKRLSGSGWVAEVDQDREPIPRYRVKIHTTSGWYVEIDIPLAAPLSFPIRNATEFKEAIEPGSDTGRTIERFARQLGQTLSKGKKPIQLLFGSAPPSVAPTAAPTTPEQATAGERCALGSNPDCVDFDGDGQGTLIIGAGECIAQSPSRSLCEDLDGDGYAGYPDSG